MSFLYKTEIRETANLHDRSMDRNSFIRRKINNMDTSIKAPSTAVTISGIIFTLGFAALPLTRWLNEFSDVPHLVLYECVWWAATSAVLVYVKQIEKKPLSSIGFLPISYRHLFISVIAAAIAIAGLVLIYLFLLPALGMSQQAAITQLLKTPLWWRIISTGRAAVSEEVLFRGYAIERLNEITGSARIAASVSWVIFTLEHVPAWGWAHIFIAGFGGLVLTMLYLFKRNLWVNILAHFLIDLTAVLL
jgi:membrane protease YdiL (CAAX protease family)